MNINVDTKLIPYLSLLEGAIGYITSPVESIQENRVDSFRKTIIFLRNNGVTEKAIAKYVDESTKEDPEGKRQDVIRLMHRAFNEFNKSEQDGPDGH